VERDDLMGGWVITMAEGDLPIRIQPNPYHRQEFPFLVSRFAEVDNEAWGRGVCELFESEQYEIADKRNQAMDAVTKNLNPRYLAKEGTFTKKKRDDKVFLGAEPDTITFVDTDEPLAAVLFPVTANLQPMEAFNAAGQLEVSLQKRVGATENFQGFQSKASESATASAARNQGASARVMLHAGDFEDEFLLPWLNMEYELLRIFKDKNEVLREVGEDGISWEIITPEDLIEGIQWTPRGSHSVQKNATLAQLMVQLFSIPTLHPYMPLAECLKIFWRANRVDNVAKLVQDPNEIPSFVPIEVQHLLFSMGHDSKPDPRLPLDQQQMEMMAHQQRIVELMQNPQMASPYEIGRLNEHLSQMGYIFQQQMMAMQQQMMMAQQGGGNPAQTGQAARPDLQPEKTTGPNSAEVGGLARGEG